MQMNSRPIKEQLFPGLRLALTFPGPLGQAGNADSKHLLRMRWRWLRGTLPAPFFQRARPRPTSCMALMQQEARGPVGPGNNWGQETELQ